MSPKLDLTLPKGVKVAPYRELPSKETPAFWDPRKAYIKYSPDTEEAFRQGVEHRLRTKGFQTAHEREAEGIANVFMGIDLQDGFRESGLLGVTGTDTVVLRACSRLLWGVLRAIYSYIVLSMDGHPQWHRSFASAWVDKAQRPFDLRVEKAAVLELVDRKMGVFRATAFGPGGKRIDKGLIQLMFDPLDAVAYWDHLQTTGQGPIWIFADHCKLGTDGTNLHPLLAETVAFAEGALAGQAMLLNKGHLTNTDWFGAFAPCRPDSNHPQGQLRTDVLEEIVRRLRMGGRLDSAGVAEDFCQYYSLLQAKDYLAAAGLLSRLTILRDCTAPIVGGAPHVVALYEEVEPLGVQFTDHHDLSVYRIAA